VGHRCTLWREKVAVERHTKFVDNKSTQQADGNDHTYHNKRRPTTDHTAFGLKRMIAANTQKNIAAS